MMTEETEPSSHKRVRYSPPLYEDEKESYCKSDKSGDWLIHNSGNWMFSVSDRAYFHVPTNAIFTEPDAERELEEGKASESSLEEDAAPDESDEEGDLDIDFQSDFRAGTYTAKGPGKEENQDRYVTLEPLPLEILSDSTACCSYSAIFDGHLGSECSQYCTNHLHNNILGYYRQTVAAHKKQEGGSAGEIEALKRSCFKAFQITDNNYLDIQKKSGDLSGSTACVLLLYGPDDDGGLLILTAHAGDSRAVLCRGDEAIALTEDHVPENQIEKKRIESEGGQVVNVAGIWRATGKFGGKVYGLSTSRALGDYPLKVPKKIVVSTPSVSGINVDFGDDLFVLLGSDGLFSKMNNQEAVDIVKSTLPSTPEHAAKTVVDAAVAKGTLDDVTATVIFFGWQASTVVPEGSPSSDGEASDDSEKEEKDAGSEEEKDTAKQNGEGKEDVERDLDIFAT